MMHLGGRMENLCIWRQRCNVELSRWEAGDAIYGSVTYVIVMDCETSRYL